METNRWTRMLSGLGLAGALLVSSGTALAQTDYRQRLAQDEVIYFLLPDRFANGDPSNDRGGLVGDRNVTGFDPSSPDYYHGGDLAGLTQRLDYIQGLGATAIWMAPIFRNKPVQARNDHTGAGYHGYWITDFTSVDPHFGDRQAMRTLVDAAHARGMKVYIDIITNHTADVIRYRECPQNDCAYRSRADYPHGRSVDGGQINAGFRGDGGSDDFAQLTRPDYAYTPYVPEGEPAKVPAWLNDLTLYHNRGDSTFRGESSLHGDFAGLDDLFTEHPRVVEGFIEVYGAWIDDYGIDGFRIDTAKHVNPEFWQAFVPAMQARARAKGIPNFHIFGEVYDHDPAALARHTRVDGLPAVLDFAFQTTATDVAIGKAAPDQLARVFAADALYEGGEAAALGLPTFLGNHDMGRIGWFIQKGLSAIGDDELLARTSLAHALMFFSRGVPTVYYGDEQGFTGQGDYGAARQDMFASAVDTYEDDRRIGGTSLPFDRSGPLYRNIAEMARLRGAHAALRRGLQTVRAAHETPGLLALTRRLPGQPAETLIVFNTGVVPLTSQIEVDVGSTIWTTVRGQCAPAAAAPGSVSVSVPPLDYIICVSEGAR